MGKLIASTFDGSAWLSYIGYPTETTSTLAEYEMAAHGDFVSHALADHGLTAVRENGDFWASSWYDKNMFGLTISTYRPFSLVGGGYQKVKSWAPAPGSWVVDSANALRYSGRWFLGCGVADPGGDGYVQNMAQVGSGTFWDKLDSVVGSESQSHGIFNLSDDVMTAGSNANAVLWESSTGATRIAPASVVGLSAAKQMASDGYYSPVFITPSGDLYYFWLVTGVMNTRLLDTGVAEIVGGAPNIGIAYRKTDGTLWYKRQHWNTTYAPAKFSDGPYVKASGELWYGYIAGVTENGRVDIFKLSTDYSLLVTDLFPNYQMQSVALVRNAAVGLEYVPPPPPPRFWQGFIGATETP